MSDLESDWNLKKKINGQIQCFSEGLETPG